MLQSMLGVLVRVDIMWLMVKEMDAIGLCKCYYGDSLGWPLPTNLEEVVRPNINKIEEDLQVDLWNSLALLFLIRSRKKLIFAVVIKSTLFRHVTMYVG